MQFKAILLGALLASTFSAPVYAQANTDITVVLSEELDLVEPCMATRSNIGRVIMQNISETLTELDVRGDKGLMGRLAESWEDLGDGTWQFKLRQNVKFSDGTDFDANDVKHSFERVFSDQITCESKRYFADTELSFDIVDPHTINIKAEPAQPILPLLMTLVTIVPEETPFEFVRNPVGTGPYVLADWTAGQQIVLERRDDYWGELPAVTKATYVFRSDPAVRAAMVETGEADIAPQITEVEATNPATDFTYPNAETVYLRIDQSIEPMGDIRVRKALNAAIDREAFIGTLLSEGTQFATAIVPPTTLGWNPDLVPPAYDPEQAKAWLAEAEADGVNIKAPIEVIARTENFPHVAEVGEAIVQMLSEVGFNASLRMVEVAEHEQYYSKPYPEGRPAQLIVAQHDNARGDPVFSMYFKYHSQGTQSGLSDPKVDDLIERASAATGEERAALWSELFAYLHDEVVADVLLFHMVGHSRVSERLDFTPTIATNQELQLSQIGFK
ncbi:ABC transporter substrate-binding protein [Chelativorans sp. SCAU2101]|uniref:ABC transporter substrate-binding protein n=1 Tax=Chelativorans petroleitrophicus TaxID=2975484 RepID=A0A9X2X9C2_9HYPH|nr:ABC transporter substrate-binding protein [Chelativorans petroleitrophicus]PZN51836.1 MAG: peptide ABC transporter substrate-binding protein [Pseudomonadota bacterium]